MTHKLIDDEDFNEVLLKCIKIMTSKNIDYSMDTGDRLHNFKTVGKFVDLSPEKVLGVYFYKHVSAIYSYINSNGQNESEPIEERICDAINYLMLLYKMVKEEKRLISEIPF